MSSVWRLTVRRGPEVTRSQHAELEEAVEQLRRQAEEVLARGPLPRRSMLRDFEPADQVAARLEISGRGLLRPPTAGIDVRGDGTVIPFSGAIRRRELASQPREDAYDTVRRALSGARA